MKFTNEQRDAIKKAAEHIYAHPEKYEFMEISVPWSTKDCGCVLGWISFFYGRRFYLYYRDLTSTARWLGYIDPGDFYNDMRRLTYQPGWKPPLSWIDDHNEAYRGLMKLIDDQQALKP